MPQQTTSHIAIDLGAESGRVMVGRVDVGGARLELEELHRFPTCRSFIAGSHRWDVLAIYNEILAGLTKAARLGEPVTSVSASSWGVDYVLLAEGHPHLVPPFMYRDPRTDAAFGRVQGDEALRTLVFEETGIQFLHFNTLYQLLADREPPGGRDLHELAGGLLMMGDYFNWLLCGVARAERSLASTSQLYNPRTRSWSRRLIETFDLRAQLLPELIDGGSTLGPLREEIARTTGLSSNVQVIATCSHDTAAAVAATPIAGDGRAYLSSGTWSLLGVELAEPIITDRCRALGFTNEVGFAHTIRLLKNISGLFILQECRRDYQHQGQEIDYADFAQQARSCEGFRSLIRPDAAQFGRVGDMTRKVAEYCRETGQPVPQSPGQFARCIYDSLALLYAQTLRQIEELTGRSIEAIHVVGGGSRSELLNQLTADVCGVPVEAGPAEATALGNVGVQAIALGGLEGLAKLRELVARCHPTVHFAPAAVRPVVAERRFAALPP